MFLCNTGLLSSGPARRVLATVDVNVQRKAEANQGTSTDFSDNKLGVLNKNFFLENGTESLKESSGQTPGKVEMQRGFSNIKERNLSTVVESDEIIECSESIEEAFGRDEDIKADLNTPAHSRVQWDTYNSLSRKNLSISVKSKQSSNEALSLTKPVRKLSGHFEKMGSTAESTVVASCSFGQRREDSHVLGSKTSEGEIGEKNVASVERKEGEEMKYRQESEENEKENKENELCEDGANPSKSEDFVGKNTEKMGEVKGESKAQRELFTAEKRKSKEEVEEESEPREIEGKVDKVDNRAKLEPRKKREDENVVWVNNTIYQKLQLVGKGGSSKVYKVIAPNRQIYALKRIKISGRDSESSRGFIDEITLLKRLKGKPNIIQLIDAEVIPEEGLIFVVLEFGEIDLANLLVKMQRNSHGSQGKPQINENFLRLYWQVEALFFPPFSPFVPLSEASPSWSLFLSLPLSSPFPLFFSLSFPPFAPLPSMLPPFPLSLSTFIPSFVHFFDIFFAFSSPPFAHSIPTLAHCIPLSTVLIPPLSRAIPLPPPLDPPRTWWRRCRGSTRRGLCTRI